MDSIIRRCPNELSKYKLNCSVPGGPSRGIIGSVDEGVGARTQKRTKRKRTGVTRQRTGKQYVARGEQYRVEDTSARTATILTTATDMQAERHRALGIEAQEEN